MIRQEERAAQLARHPDGGANAPISRQRRRAQRSTQQQQIAALMLARHPDGSSGARAVNQQARRDQDIGRLVRTFHDADRSLSRRLSAARVLRTRHNLPVSQAKFLDDIRTAPDRRKRRTYRELERRADQLPRQSREFQNIRREASALRLPDTDTRFWQTKPGQVAIDILEETTRPLHALAATEREVIAGLKGERRVTRESAAKAFWRGLKNEDKSTFSDVLGDLGVPKGPVRSGLGFVGDVAGDPLTYVTFGTATVGRQAILKAGQNASRKLDRVRAQAARQRPSAATGRRVPYSAESRYGVEVERRVERLRRRHGKVTDRQRAAIERDVAERMGSRGGEAIVRRAERQAAERAARKGTRITVGTRRHQVRIPGSQIVTAPARRLRERPVVEDALAAVNPRLRRAGVPDDAHEQLVAAQLRGRATIANEERRLQDLVRVFRKKFKENDYQRIVDAVESGSLKSLGRPGDELYDAALTLRSHFRHLDRLDRQAGVRAGSRKNYVAHVRRQDAEGDQLGRVLSSPSVRPGSSKRRTIDKRMAQLRDERPELFTDDIPQILAARTPQSYRAGARIRVFRELAATGRPWVANRERPPQLREGEAVYHIPARGSTPRKVEKQSELNRALTSAEERIAAARTAREKGSHVTPGKRKEALERSKAPEAGQYVILNERLADEVIARAARPEPGPNLKRYRRLHGNVKTVLTQWNPAYHARNLYGDISNASYNQNVAELTRSLPQAAKVLGARRKLRKGQKTLDPARRAGASVSGTVKIRGKRVPIQQVIREAEEHGALNLGFSQELRRLAGETDPGRLTGSRNFGESRENLVRLATYIGARNQGLSAREAALRVMDTHFDYSLLTHTERGLRDVMPFYTFAARNTPLQAKTLLTKPGKLARYQKLIEEGAKAAGLPEDWQDKLQEYEAYGVPIPLFGLAITLKNGEKLPLHALAGLPITDLNRLNVNPYEQAKQLGTMITVFKAVPEVLFNYSLFFRDQIEKDDRKVNAPEWVGSLPKDFREQPFVDAEYVYDRALGKKVWKWKAKWDYLVKQLPQTSLAMQLTTDAKNRRGQDHKLAAIGGITGVRAQPYDELRAAVDRSHKRLEATERRLRDLGRQNINAQRPNDEYKRLSERKKRLERQIYLLTLRQRRRGESVSVPSSFKPREKSAGERILNQAGIDTSAESPATQILERHGLVPRRSPAERILRRHRLR